MSFNFNLTITFQHLTFFSKILFSYDLLLLHNVKRNFKKKTFSDFLKQLMYYFDQLKIDFTTYDYNFFSIVN